MDYQPPHYYTDPAKLAAMVAVLNAGLDLPPILVCGEIAYSGSHRLAAYDAVGRQIPTREITEEQVAAAMLACGLDPGYDTISDYEEFEWAIDHAS